MAEVSRANEASYRPMVRKRIKTDSDPGDSNEEGVDFVTSGASSASDARSRKLLKFKSREYMIPEDKRRLKLQLRRFRRVTKEPRRFSVRFNETVEIRYFPYEPYFKRHRRDNKFFLGSGYFLLDHKSKEAILEVDPLSETFTNRELALDYWCEKIRNGMRLTSISNQNGNLNCSHYIKRLPNGLVPVPKRMSITELKRGNDQPYFKWITFKDLKQTDLRKKKITADLQLFKTAVANVLGTFGFDRNFKKNARLQLETTYLNKLNQMKFLLSGYVEKDFLLQVFVRSMTVTSMLAEIRKKEFSRVVRKLAGVEILSSKTPKVVFNTAKKELNLIFRLLDQVSKFVNGVDSSIQTKPLCSMTFQKFHINDLMKQAHFGKVLVAMDEYRYRCLVTGSIFVAEVDENSKRVYKVNLIKGIPEAKLDQYPKKDDIIQKPELVLDLTYKLLPSIFINVQAYWARCRIGWLEEYMNLTNSGMVCAIINNNLRMVNFFENLEVHDALKKISCQVAEGSHGITSHDSKSVAHVLKVYKKHAREKGSLKLSSLSLVLNPVMRADLYFSRFRGFITDADVVGHGGKLLSTVILMGNVNMAKYLISKGVSIRKKVPTNDTKHMYWEFPRKTKASTKRRMKAKAASERTVKDQNQQVPTPKKDTAVSNPNVGNVGPVVSHDEVKGKDSPQVEKSLPKKKRWSVLKVLNKRHNSKVGKLNNKKTKSGVVKKRPPLPQVKEGAIPHVADSMNIKADKKVRLISVPCLAEISTIAIEALVDSVVIPRKSYSARGSRRMIQSIKARFEFAMEILSSKKTKVLRNDGAVIRALVPSFVSLYKALRKFPEEKKSNLNFSKLEFAAMKAYKNSLKQSDYKLQVTQYIAVVVLKVINKVLQKAMQELKHSRKLHVITLLLIDESIQRDQYQIIPHLCSDVAILRKVLKMLGKRLGQPLASHRRILKAIFVFEQLFPEILNTNLTASLFNNNNLKNLFISDFNAKPGSAEYIGKVFEIPQVQNYICQLHHNKVSLVYSALGSLGINNTWISGKARDSSTDINTLDLAFCYYSMMRKHLMLSLEQLEQIDEEVLGSVLENLLRCNPVVPPIMRPIYQLIEYNPKFLGHCDESILMTFLLGTFSKSSNFYKVSFDDAAGDLTVLLLVKTITNLFFIENICNLDQNVVKFYFLQLIQQLEELPVNSYQPFLVLDFIETVWKGIGQTWKIAENEAVQKLIGKCFEFECFAINWDLDGDMINMMEYKGGMTATGFIEHLESLQKNDDDDVS